MPGQWSRTVTYHLVRVHFSEGMAGFIDVEQVPLGLRTCTRFLGLCPMAKTPNSA